MNEWASALSRKHVNLNKVPSVVRRFVLCMEDIKWNEISLIFINSTPYNLKGTVSQVGSLFFYSIVKILN